MGAERHLSSVPDPQPSRAERVAALLVQTGRGSAPAFERLFDVMSPSVYGVALRVVRDPHLAEDVAQEALVEVWRLAPRYRPDAGQAVSWILTIAHRRAIDRVRSEQAHRERTAGFAASAPGPGGADPETVVEAMHNEWEAARVRAGLAALTPLQREAIELAYYKGYTHREVAEALDVPLGTGKARLRDGLIKLRDAWEVER